MIKQCYTNAVKILGASVAVGMIFMVVSIASASAATLSYVGPHLSSNTATAEKQVATMLHHDQSVQAFYAHALRVHKWEVRKAQVLELKFGHCVIGIGKKCPFNTGKNEAGKVVKTSYRYGERRKVAYVKVAIGKQEFWVTIEAPCVNLLSGGKPLRKRPPHIRVRPKKPITYRLVIESLSISRSSSSASASCPSGTVTSEANAGALAGAKVSFKVKVYRQGRRHSWGALYRKIRPTVTYTDTSTDTHVTCPYSPPATPPCNCSTPPPPEEHPCGCEETPPPEEHPCGCTPPPAPENPSVQIGQKNDVDVSNTATVCVDYNVPGSDSATLKFTSGYGSYSGGSTFTVSGQGSKCTTYTAPSEVPPSGFDTLTASLRDNVTGLSDNTPSNNSTNIRINPKPQPPL